MLGALEKLLVSRENLEKVWNAVVRAETFLTLDTLSLGVRKGPESSVCNFHKDERRELSYLLTPT